MKPMLSKDESYAICILQATYSTSRLVHPWSLFVVFFSLAQTFSLPKAGLPSKCLMRVNGNEVHTLLAGC